MNSQDAAPDSIGMCKKKAIRQHLIETLRNVIQGVNAEVGEKFFQSVIVHLAKSLGAFCALIGEYVQGAKEAVSTVCVCVDGKIVENFTYTLAGTPCANVIGKGVRIYPVGVADLFPEDTVLRELSLEGYVGVPLYDSQQRALGIMVAAFQRPIENPQYVETILQIFSTRTAAEIERRNVELALRQSEERLQAQAEALAQADRRKDEFLAMLAHELRNPLAPIYNSAQILQLTCPQDSSIQPRLKIIDRQITHMARLLDDLLDVSRITQGKINLNRKTLGLGAIIDQAMETAAPMIESRGQTLHATLPPGTLRINADPDRMSQVIGNLLINASKYTDQGGQIWLEAGCQGDWAVVRVRDNGVGIAPDMQASIFDLFAQADHSLGRSQGGLGIGLTLVKRLVAMHGGTVEARSEGLGQGSEFIIRLPALPSVGLAA